jgi:organic hydroperoxide reductase OsmC/OhrA
MNRGRLEAFSDGVIRGDPVVTLRPEVAFAGSPAPAETQRALHHEAHEACFIASSVKTEVRSEPVGI